MFAYATSTTLPAGAFSQACQEENLKYLMLSSVQYFLYARPALTCISVDCLKVSPCGLYLYCLKDYTFTDMSSFFRVAEVGAVVLKPPNPWGPVTGVTISPPDKPRLRGLTDTGVVSVSVSVPINFQNQEIEKMKLGGALAFLHTSLMTGFHTKKLRAVIDYIIFLINP